MDNYISEKQFSSQSYKVQMEILNWCRDNIKGTDLIQDKENKRVDIFSNLANDTLYSPIPLLQIHQLIQIIEDKTKNKLNIEYDFKKGYLFYFKIFNNRDLITPIINKYISNETDLLQALWKVTIQIIER